MGGMFSNPVDGETKQEMEELIKGVIKTFTLEYTKAYALALVAFLKEEAKAGPPETWKLLERPPWNRDLKEGWLMKEGGIRKNWKKRYFVVRPNYSIDYYESEAEAKKEKGKKKGTISLCGYSVVDDVNNGILNKLKKLAEKMGMDTSELPKPKEYPEHTLELHHDRRRCYFVQAENHEQFKQWLEQFRSCAWRAHGYTNEDPVHQHAFDEAIRKTRWELGRWGWWSWGGSEEQILSDLISDQIDWAVMGRIYSKIQGAWTVRNAIRNQVLKAIDKAVSAAVKPAWGAMDKVVKELRTKIEPTIKEMVDPIGKLEAEIIEKIKNAVMSQLEPVLQEHVVPHLSKIMEVVKEPMNQGYDECYKIFDEHISKWEPKGTTRDELVKSFYDLDWVPRSWHMYPATDKLSVLYDPLWALHAIFPDIYPWSTVWDGQDELRKRTDNAIYTWEERLLEAVEKEGGDAKSHGEKLKPLVIADFKEDAQKAVGFYYHAILKKIVLPPFEALVVPACKAVLEPLADAVPEPMQQFVNIIKMFEEVYNGVIDDSIKVVLG